MDDIRLEPDISLENGNINRQVNRRRNERDRLRRDEINNRQNARNAARYERMHCIARNNTIPDYKYLGEMNYVCQHCGAKKFPDETHFLCCHNGKVVLSQPSSFPQDLEDLFKGNYADRIANLNFFKYIRNYNACLSFASFEANVVQPMNHGPPCFRICGQVFQHIGNLRLNQDIPPTYCQLYIYDLLAAVNFRIQQSGNDLCLNDLMFRLQTIITEENPFALAFKYMVEVEDEEICQAALEGCSESVVKMSLVEGQDRRRCNLLSHNEVAVVFVGEDGAPPASREVVIYSRGHPLKTISSMSANLDPMVYPLFFPRGDAGWHNQLVHNPERAALVRNHVTLSQNYNYKLSVRQFFSSLFYGKKLFQQYAVDAYVKIEAQGLAIIRNNQNKLRSKQYDVLHEHVMISTTLEMIIMLDQGVL